MPHPFKVRQVGKSYVFRYSQCKSDHDGWIHSDYYLPYPYDLVDVRIKRKGKWVEKIKTGWWTGEQWEGSYIKPGDQIFFWKKKDQEESWASL